MGFLGLCNQQWYSQASLQVLLVVDIEYVCYAHIATYMYILLVFPISDILTKTKTNKNKKSPKNKQIAALSLWEQQVTVKALL